MLAPYVDGFWINPVDTADAQRIVNDARKPVIIADYSSADPDSQDDISGVVSKVAYDSSTGTTTLTVPGLKYWLPNSVLLQFPGLSGATGNCLYSPNPRVQSQHWNNLAGSTLTVGGNYSCLPAGVHVGSYAYGAVTNYGQPVRASAIINRWNSMVNLSDPAGHRDVVGLEHWAYFDESVGNTGSNQDFGIFTPNDNPYDGSAAVQAAGTDTNGYTTGGEERNYGNLLTGSGSLGSWLASIYSILQ